MRKTVTILSSVLLALQLSAQSNFKQDLVRLFNEAEYSYLIDDYQQLLSCINDYADVFKANLYHMGDSSDVYEAYYNKMCGAYYYGLTNNDAYADKSEAFYKESLRVFNKRNDVAHAIVLHEELAQLYYKNKDYVNAQEQLSFVLNYYDEQVHDMGITSLETNYYQSLSQLAMCNARRGVFELAMEQIDKAIDQFYKKHKDYQYFEALRKRGKILMIQAEVLGNTHYKKAVDNYRKYINERYEAIERELNTMNESQRNQYWLATHQFLYDCFRLGNYAPEMLYDLTLFSKDYLVRKNATRTNWKQVRKALGKKECAIEFVQYFGERDKRRLGCLVLRSDSKKPLFIDLFATDSLLDLPLTETNTIGGAITNSSSSIKDTLYNDPRLPAHIWSEPLLRAIGDAQKVYFSPDGLLNQLAIEYLMPDTSKICYRLSSTRILTQQRTAPKMDSALLCGGIAYSATIHPNDRDNDVVAYRFLAPQIETVKDMIWTKVEIDSIYATRNTSSDTLLVGKDATDEAFLKLLKRNYDVIHLSTHGYYAGRIGIFNDIKPLLGDESMSKSGLLFAGVANTLTDKDFDEELFDGVLSAAELSRQDLSKSQLIVLSACQTGLGHLTDDGIYGIQRGLKIAGANAMILTLWSISDRSSCFLMHFFYEELNKQKSTDIHAAFLKARQRLIDREETILHFDASTLSFKEDALKYNTPRHVNPFIIIDAY